MNIEEFKNVYVSQKDAEKIKIKCDHPYHVGEALLEIGKQPARRNILKNNGERFICRNCCMKYDNPMNKVGKGRQTDEVIIVICPHPSHKGDRGREMKKACYYGWMQEPYEQVCGSCIQLGKVISEEQKAAISEKLKGIPKSEEFKENLRSYLKEHPERREQAIEVLLANKCTTGMLGKEHSKETKQKMSAAHSGKVFTEIHCNNISDGRKKMLAEQGGFTKKHRENISKATIKQYENGFEPNLHHKSGWYGSHKVGNVYYRSSYELKAFCILDSDESVVNYKTEQIKVEFYNPEKKINGNYIIDLEVEYNDGSKKLIEIKPAKWLSDPVVQAKIEAGKLEAKRIGIAFEVWTEMELFGSAVYNKKHITNFVEKMTGEYND